MKREKFYKQDLIQYRLDLAQVMLRDARLLKENGGSPVSIINRAYYSIFYAALSRCSEFLSYLDDANQLIFRHCSDSTDVIKVWLWQSEGRTV